MKKKVISKAIENVNVDRNTARRMLEELDNWAHTAGQTDRLKEVSQSLAKFLEVLQKSNEQLIKLAALMKEDEEEVLEGDALFDELAKEPEEER